MSRGKFAATIAALFLAACAPYSPGRPVHPAPPGPVDAIKSLWGDYSARCPDGFAFCKASGEGDSLCCPGGQRCCEDANGPYCCAASHADGGRGSYSYDDRRSDARTSCWSNEITCSHLGQTICCGGGDGCCAGPSGPYCCAEGGAR